MSTDLIIFHEVISTYYSKNGLILVPGGVEAVSVVDAYVAGVVLVVSVKEVEALLNKIIWLLLLVNF